MRTNESYHRQDESIHTSTVMSNNYFVRLVYIILFIIICQYHNVCYGTPNEGRNLYNGINNFQDTLVLNDNDGEFSYSNINGNIKDYSD